MSPRIWILIILAAVGLIGLFLFPRPLDRDPVPTAPPPAETTPAPEEEIATEEGWRFDLEGISTVVVRAQKAAQLVAVPDSTREDLHLDASPAGGVKGYHPSDPSWQETPPEEWGLEFVAERHGPTLVVSTRNEIRHLHHHYYMDEIRVRLPPGIELQQEARELTGDGAADLTPPR